MSPAEPNNRAAYDQFGPLVSFKLGASATPVSAPLISDNPSLERAYAADTTGSGFEDDYGYAYNTSLTRDRNGALRVIITGYLANEFSGCAIPVAEWPDGTMSWAKLGRCLWFGDGDDDLEAMYAIRSERARRARSAFTKAA
jgi:hypothetical protein